MLLSKLHLVFIKINFFNNARKTIYKRLTLYDYLLQIDRDAEDTFNRLVKQMAEREGVTEQRKADNQMEWVGLMNNISQRAMEMVNTDLIYI